MIFRDEFAASQDPYLLLDPRKGLHIVDINEAYGTATMTSSAKIAGCPLFDVFPDNPEDPTADGRQQSFRITQEGRRTRHCRRNAYPALLCTEPARPVRDEILEAGQQADFRCRG